ncbi:hypothetical protein GGQ73_002935 [Rhizobium skierniewicense]|uniref:Integrase n=1 Tax=Rhizobium skierniewicense TaxID=984260 RepID=A0A7W6G3Y7_9HYPH|nr:hypothetical protein [Rhizobium skierniewicense]MBB3946971.1 hypothetical protein [Rhizobium skierniewicense]
MKEFARFINDSRELAEKKNVSWNISVDAVGNIVKGHRLELGRMAGSRQNGPSFSRTMPDEKTLDLMNIIRARQRLDPIFCKAPAEPWIDLMMAVIIDQIFVKVNRPAQVQRHLLMIRIIAAESGPTPPWQLEPSTVRRAYNVALGIGASGKSALDLSTTIKVYFDQLRLAEVPALGKYCVAYDDAAGEERVRSRKAYQNDRHASNQILDRLSDRRSPEKLPDKRSYFMIVDIVFAMEPHNVSDWIRFSAIKLMIVTGLRAEEVLGAPVNCLSWREYLDSDGNPPALGGGVSREVFFRYFGLKKESESNRGSAALYETSQNVPLLFQRIFEDTVDDVRRVTAPARERLAAQAASGRLLPEYGRHEIVPAMEIFSRLTGNLKYADCELPPEVVAAYRKSLDFEHLKSLRDYQESCGRVSHTVISFFSRKSFQPYDHHGTPILGKNKNWFSCYFRVGEVEDALQCELVTKSPELNSLVMQGDRRYGTHDMLFLMPVRNLVEGRNRGVLDVERYYAFGRADYGDIDLALDGSNPNSIFRRYLGEDGSSLCVNTLEFRHLLSDVLFCNHVSDVINAKFFGRHTLKRTAQYDHTTLSKVLEEMDIGVEEDELLDDTQREMIAEILRDSIGGLKVEQFRKIQREKGDKAAVRYLAGAVAGFTITPLGACTSNFVAAPCPRHLECFRRCEHLTRTSDPAEAQRLDDLLEGFEIQRDAILEIPEARRTLGWQSQLSHVNVQIEGTQAAIAAAPGSKVFANGDDLFLPVEDEEDILPRKPPRG